MITLRFPCRGYAVAKLRFPGRHWLSTGASDLFDSGNYSRDPFYAILSQLGMRNSLFALWRSSNYDPGSCLYFVDIFPAYHLI